MYHIIAVILGAQSTAHAVELSPAEQAAGFFVDYSTPYSERSRLNIRHCRPLEIAADLLREKLGWRLVVESPTIVFAGDLQVIDGGEARSGRCGRTVTFDVTIDSSDPLGGASALAVAYNAAGPPFLVDAAACRTAVCITPTEVRDGTGSLVPVNGLLDTPISTDDSPRTVLDLTNEVATQLRVTGHDIRFNQLLPEYRGQWNSVVLQTEYADVPAREVLLDLIEALSDFDTEDTLASDFRRRRYNALMDLFTAESSLFIPQAMRKGLSSQEIDAAWSQRRAEIQSGFDYGAPPVAPPRELGVGPGWVFTQTTVYPITGGELTLLELDPVSPSRLLNIRTLAPGDSLQESVDAERAEPPLPPPPIDDPTCLSHPCKNGKVSVCHKPAEPAENTLCISENAVPAHVGHGDVCGICP